MPFTVTQLLCGLVAPAALLLVVAGIAWRCCRDARWVFGPLVALGFALAYLNLEPRPGWPPNQNVLYLLFYFTPVAGVLILADSLLHPPTWLRAGALFILWRIAARLFLARQVPSSISPSALEPWVDVSALVTVVWWLAFETMAQRWSGVTVPLLLAALAGASAIVLAMGWHIQSSGALAVAIFGICVAAAVLGAFSNRVAFSRGFAGMIVLLLHLVLLHGYFYTDDTLTGTQEVLLTALLTSPLLAFIGEARFIRRQRPAWRILARIVIVGILLAVVCAVTIGNYLHAERAAAMQDE